MNDANEILAIRSALHFMLKAALLEIRASETVHAAKKIADVFHRLPMALLDCVEKEDYEAEFKHLQDRGERVGLGSYIENLRRAAIRSIASK